MSPSAFSAATAQPPTPERLLALIEAMPGQPVVLLADLVVDRFLTGAPKRISREAPVLILSLESDITIPGGGANAVANVAALGGNARVAGVVGKDESGRELLRLFEERAIDVSGVAIVDGYKTPTKTRVLGGGRHSIKQQIVRFDVEDNWCPDTAAAQAYGETLITIAAHAKVAVVSDYGYGEATPELVARLAQRHPGLPLLGDSRYRLDQLTGVSGATPNLEEAEALVGGSLDGLDDLEQGGHQLRQRLGFEFLLITRGSAGMSLFLPNEVIHMPVHGTDEVADVTGAGDTVIGTFALALASGASPLEASCLANYAGGLVVMKMGTATVSGQELRSAVVDDPAWLERLAWRPTSD